MKRNRLPLTARGTPACAACHAPLPWIVDAGEDTYREAITSTRGLPVIVDLWAPWCGPCRALTPALERLAAQRAGRLKLVKVDVDTAPRLASMLNVQGVPTLLLVVDGTVTARQVGALPGHALAGWLDTNVTSPG
jgi:thioredoxin 2